MNGKIISKKEEPLMAEEEKKAVKAKKPKKLADPKAISIDPATQQMQARAQELGIDTVYDRAVQMRPCNIGVQGTCCKNCSMGPCRLPLPKAGIEGEDTRKGLCGATANTIAARNFIRMIAGGASAHSDHGRCVAEVFMSAAKKETDAYKIKNLIKQGTRAAIADGWGGSMLATDLQDVLFGTPYPLQSEANLGVMKEDHVNIIVHGHEPVLSEIIVSVTQNQKMIDYAKSKGAKGIQLSGICCTANEILQRHGIPSATTFLSQELAIITGACDAMVVDIQCIFQNLANVAECFHTHLITTHPIAKMEQDSVIHIEFDEHHAVRDAERIVKMAIDNFKNRKAEVMIPKHKAVQIAGFGVESIEYHLGGTFRGTYYTLNDNIINGRIRGVAGVVGCNNARTVHNRDHIMVVKELIKNDVLVLTTGCNGIACAMEGLLTPETAQVFCGAGLAEVCEVVGIPPVLHLGSCVDNSRILLAATEVVKAGGLGKDISDLPAAGSAPEWMSEKAISIGHYFVVSGVYTVFGVTLPTSGAPVFHDYICKDLEKIYGGMWDIEPDPIKHARLMIAHIDKKRKELGIDKARERVLMDMDDRMKMEAAYQK